MLGVDSKVELDHAVAMILYLYRIVLWFFLPFIFVRLLWRSLREPEYAKRIPERFGFAASLKSCDRIWFHTVSAGETISAAPVIKNLIQPRLGLSALVTTMTPSGSAMVRKIFNDSVEHRYLPYDYTFAVSRIFDQVRPKILVLMETELWPNLINEAWEREIPVICINARLSEKSARRYGLIRPLVKKLLGQIDFVACQYEQHVERFRELGVADEKISALGNMKFDIDLPAEIIGRSVDKKKAWGFANRPIWIAASTHDGEEQIVLDAYKLLKKTYSELVLILVPRHPSRAVRVGQYFTQSGFSVCYESSKVNTQSLIDIDVLIGDVMGSLVELYGLADVAMVGGSFARVGGHNPIEPAAYGLPIIVGPQQYNFSEVMIEFEKNGGLITVSDSRELFESLIYLFGAEEQRLKMGTAALRTIEKNKGATQKLTKLLEARVSRIVT